MDNSQGDKTESESLVTMKAEKETWKALGARKTKKEKDRVLNELTL